MFNSQPQLIPLLTPFTDDTAQVSEVRLARLVRWHHERGAGGFVVGGEAGEVHALSHSERKQVLEWVMRDCAGKPVFVQVTANTTSNTVDLCQHASRHGAKGALYAPPHLGLGEEEVRSALTSIKRHGDLPIAVFETPFAAEFSSDGCKSLEDIGLGALCFHRTAMLDEFVFGNYVLSPLNIFGAENAQKFEKNWPQFKLRLHALFRHGKSHRVGKELMEQLGLELGPPRPPIHRLDATGREIIKSLLADIA